MSIEVHQCPHCELRFAAKWELEQHLAQDHERDGDGGEDEAADD